MRTGLSTMLRIEKSKNCKITVFEISECTHRQNKALLGVMGAHCDGEDNGQGGGGNLEAAVMEG